MRRKTRWSARRETRRSARRETRQVSAPEHAECARRCARSVRVGARGVCASVRAEQARRRAWSTRVGARVAGPADPAFLLSRLLAERSRRLGPRERAGAAGRGVPAVSPRGVPHSARGLQPAIA